MSALATVAGSAASPVSPPRLCPPIVTLPINSIQLDPRNPRQHSAKQIGQIARSISTFGFNVPLLIDPSSKLIAGHGRLLACRKLGWTEVPTICLDHLSEAQARAFMITDNKLTENSTWDDKLLAESLKALSVLELDFSLEVLGFEMGEIDCRIQGLDGGVESDVADVLPPPSSASVPAVSVSGDLWVLGSHRVLCADSLLAPSYEQLMGGALATVVFEDPPYNVAIDGHVGGKGAIKHREFAMGCGEMSSPEFTQFLTVVFGHAARHSTNGSIHYQCMDWRHVAEITAAGAASYSALKNICVWSKNVGGMGSLYRSRHELIFVFKNGTAAHINNVELGRHGRYRTNIWEYSSIASTRKATDEGDLLALHPTVKPVRLVADAILDVSKRGDIVLDAFLGSGSTLIAAQRTGRVCHGMEIDPLYVDTAIRRWRADTGGDAVLVATGETFTEVERRKLLAEQSAAESVDTRIEGVGHGV